MAGTLRARLQYRDGNNEPVDEKVLNVVRTEVENGVAQVITDDGGGAVTREVTIGTDGKCMTELDS